MKIFKYSRISSTQEKAKKIKNPKEPVAVFALSQTGGKGTKGRKFLSPEGSIYMSYVVPYPCKAKEAFSIMVSSATAVVKTLKAFGVQAGIKWPNDIFANGKKIAGILIENELSGEDVKKSVIGIGLNVNAEIPDEIKEIAISAKEILNSPLPLDAVLATLLYNLSSGSSTIEEYKNNSLILGKTVTVKRGEESFVGVAKDISERGELILESGEVLSAAEVSIAT